MKSYFAYIRVSTVKQGEKGSSLQEQRAAIEAYAHRNALGIAEWFEEQETAAKRGRPVFSRMLKLLREGRAHGVIIHKIDRSARNLRDWADINELIDSGVEIHLAHENLDLHSRGGRLSADIQAVVAADFIRNLRDEVRKGIEGRLKQGLYPLPAPIGYRDNGKGHTKTIDPVSGPLVRKAFELYATGRYSLDALRRELHTLGLRNRRGGRLTKTGLSTLLNNVFYVGIIRIRRSGAHYEGAHEPLIPKSLFDRVQTLLRAKVRSRGWKHDFLYRRSLRCRHCGHVLIGERQKGHAYYRCHTRSCPRTSLREESIAAQVAEALGKLHIAPSELVLLRAHLAARLEQRAEERERAERALSLGLAQLDERMTRLTDAYLDRDIDKATFEERKRRILDDRARLREQLANLRAGGPTAVERAQQKLELIKSLLQSDSPAKPDESLSLLKSASSNLGADGNYVVVDWDWPFNRLVAREEFVYGARERT